jgi:hypothetical protein
LKIRVGITPEQLEGIGRDVKYACARDRNVENGADILHPLTLAFLQEVILATTKKTELITQESCEFGEVTEIIQREMETETEEKNG